MPLDEQDEPTAGTLFVYGVVILAIASGFVLAADIAIRTIARYIP